MSELTQDPNTGLRAIEERSIDYVPENERHGSVRMQGPFWFLGNFQPFTVSIGFLGPVFGLSLWWTCVASITGILFGTLFMAAHASQGPKLGLPQMIQSRAQFGYQGVILPLIATGFTFLAFNVVDTIIIKEGLNGIFGWNTALIAVVITVIGAALAIYGHDWLHTAFQILFWVSVPFWVILTIGVLTGNAGGTAADAGGFSWAGFLGLFAVAASYNITYAPYVSDYSRYLPKNTPTGSIIASVFVGAAGSPIWLIPLGAWMSIKLGATDPLVGIYDTGNNVFNGLGGIVAVLSVLALVATMGLNAYSGMLTFVTGIDAFKPIKPTRRIRINTIVVLAVIWLVLGLVLTDSVSSLNNALLAMLYLLAPWTAINLVDFFLVRHGRYAITDLFDPSGGIYSRWNWRGVVAYLVAIAVEVPFGYINGVYTSWGYEKLNFVDISWILAMLVGGLLYAILMRSNDLASETPAIEASEKTLAETGLAR
jgi:NCS1 family nucleobase:cation symporter-1